jgi:hypothetical protein
MRLVAHHVAELDATLGDRAQQVDAAARRRLLAAGLAIGRTHGQAQPAVHAVE